MALRISVWDSKHLQTLILALSALDKDVRRELRKYTKPMVEAEWKQAVREHATTRLEHRVLADTARVAVSDQNVTLKSATIGRSLSGGLSPKQHYGQVEFGSSLHASQVTRRSKNGKTYTYKRTTGAQFKHENRKGWVVYPAAAAIIPRIASLWVQTIVRTFHEAVEKSSNG